MSVPQGACFKSAVEGEQLLMGFNGPKLLSVQLESKFGGSPGTKLKETESSEQDQIVLGQFGSFKFVPGVLTSYEASRIEGVPTHTLSTTLVGPIAGPKVGTKARSLSQLCTGSISIDLTQPIGEGSFAILNGKQGSGRSTVVQQTINAFLDSSNSAYVVYLGLSQSEAKKLVNQTKNVDRCIVVCPEPNASDSSVFVNTEAAVRTAIELKNAGNRVLCVVSDFNLVLSAGLAVAKDLGTHYLPRNFLYPLMDHSYCFKNGSSLTTLIVTEDPALESPHFMTLLQYHNLCKSASKNIIHFGTSNTVPVGTDLQLLPSPFGFQSPYVRLLSQRLFSLLLKLRDQKQEITQYKSLGLHVDPWDHYLYYDSGYFTKLLLHRRPLSLEEQMIVAHFVLRSIATDTVGYLQTDPEVLINELIQAAQKPLPSGISVMETLKLAKSAEDVSQTDTLLNAFYDIFFEQQRAEGKLRQDKADYL